MRCWLRCAFALAALGLLRVEGFSAHISTSRLIGNLREPPVHDERLPVAEIEDASDSHIRHGIGYSIRRKLLEVHEAMWNQLIEPGTVRHPMWHFEAFQLRGWQVWICCVSLFLAGILCSAGGIGGGGVYVTVLMVAGGLEIADAVPLSKAVVFLGSISALTLNLRKTFDTDYATKETLVDFNICRLIVPASLGGTYVGVFLNRILPSWVVGAVLTITLLVITILVLRATIQQYIEENSTSKPEECASPPEPASPAPASPAPASPAAASPKAAENSEDGNEMSVSVSDETHGSRARKLSHRKMPSGPAAASGEGAPSGSETREGRHDRPGRYTWHAGPHTLQGAPADMRGTLEMKDGVFALMMLTVVVLCSTFRFHAKACQNAAPDELAEMCQHPVFQWLGKDTLRRWMHQDGTAELLLILAFVCPLTVCAIVVVYYNRVLIKGQGWQFKEVLMYDTMSIFTGALAGLVGIGGGLIISPFLLFMNLEPAVAVATSSTCVIFTSSSTTLQYLLSDRIIMSLTLVYGIVNLAASYAGTKLVHFIQEKLSCRWYISAIVAAGVFLSTVLSLTQMMKHAQTS